MAKFTSGSYGLVAQVLRGVKPERGPAKSNDIGEHLAVVVASASMGQWEATCLAFLNHFRQDNPRFDSARFLKACKGDT